MYSISICINDLIAANRAVRAGNGKHYINVIVANKKEKDKYDNDATCYVKQTDAERKAKDPKKYLGDGRWLEFEGKPRPENYFYELSLCLEDMKDYTTVSARNGKQYVQICVADRKEPGQYGETATVFISQTKEQREAKEDKHYCGSGKKMEYRGGVQAAESDLLAMFAMPVAKPADPQEPANPPAASKPTKSGKGKQTVSQPDDLPF